MANNLDDASSLMSNANASTAELIPKPKPAAAGSTSNATASIASRTDRPTMPAMLAGKDWESAYAKLAGSIGFSGDSPQLPPRSKSKKDESSSKKPSKTKDANSSNLSGDGSSKPRK